MSTCFTPSVNLTGRSALITGTPVVSLCTSRSEAFGAAKTPRTQMVVLPPPGIPSGDDPLEKAPMRSFAQGFVPLPEETYANRSFTTELPQTWQGEVTTIGVSEIGPVTEDLVEKAREIPVDADASRAFVEFSQMVKGERQEALAEQARRATSPVGGRPTCGDQEGRGVVSNFQTIYLDGVKCVEYWGAPNGNVPKLFGGSSA